MTRVRRRRLRDELARRYPELGVEGADLIEAGAVFVDGIPRTNPLSVVAETVSIRVSSDKRQLRGYTKLSAALDIAGTAVDGKTAIDAGAAAGGFTRALLDRGARRVYAVEVGHGQLLGTLRQNERVTNLERTNIGHLTAQLVPDPIDVVTLDLGYLALAIAVPQLNAVTFAEGASLLALVKPMSELGLGELPTDDAQVDEAIARASAGISAAGWAISRTFRSPQFGAHGAIEAWVYAARL